MTVDDILLKALKGRKPATVNDILKHFERRVRIRGAVKWVLVISLQRFVRYPRL